MDIDDIHGLVDDLAGDVTQLETALEPLVEEALANSASKLPLLDKAKLYVLATYTLESILFSYLRLNGINAKDHPIFKEITRVRSYFAKIKLAEGGTAGTSEPGARLNKDVARRLMKHDLSGNKAYDRERAAREAHGKKTRLEDVATGKHTRLDANGKEVAIRVVKASEAISDSEEDEDGANAVDTPNDQIPSAQLIQGHDESATAAGDQEGKSQPAKDKRSKKRKRRSNKDS